MTDRLSVRPVQISDAERLAEIYLYYVNDTAVSFEAHDHGEKLKGRAEEERGHRSGVDRKVSGKVVGFEYSFAKEYL